MILLDICTDCTWQIIPMLLGAWLLGWLFWWLFNRSTYQNRIAELEKDLKLWQDKATDLEAELSKLRYDYEKSAASLASLKGKYADLEVALAACEEEKNNMGDTVVKAGSDPAVTGFVAADGGRGLDYGAAFQNDNLQLVEGIGPKIEELLKNNGIGNWATLAATDPDRLKSILEGEGARYRMHDPSTWPRQAQLANEGKWKELEEYQLFLGGGKDTGVTGGGEAKINKMAAKILGITLYQPNDLKLVEGIGPKIEEVLKNAGVKNWAELAGTSVDRLQQILDSAGDRFRLADPGSWPRQAQLAVEGKWDELQEYQDFLIGGK